MKGEFDEVRFVITVLIDIGFRISSHKGFKRGKFQNRIDQRLSGGPMGKQAKSVHAAKTVRRRHSNFRPHASI